MKSFLPLLVLLFACNAAADPRPCEQVSNFIGDSIQFMKDSWQMRELTSGSFERDLEFARQQGINYIGVDLTNSSERETLICRAFDLHRLNEVYDFIMTETPLAQYNVPYEELCYGYQSMLAAKEQGFILQFDVEFVDTLYQFVKDFVKWMESSGFPREFPIGGTHEDNVNALKELEGRIDALYDPDARRNYKQIALKDMFTRLLPIGPLRRWQIQDGKNRTSVEEVLGWLENSPSIFAYAEELRLHTSKWLSLGTVKESTDVLEIQRSHYEKIQLYRAALIHVLKTDLLDLDVSDCPVFEERYPHY